jgi:multicomponent K+:H+ antiporter subunit E
MIRNWLPHPLMTLVLIFVWMFLLNEFSLGGLLLGIVLGIIIPRITSNFWPERPPIRAYGKAVRFFGLVTWDIIVANIAVAKLILFVPNKKLNSQWMIIPLDIKSPEGITTLAGVITLTPGTVSSDISEDGRSLLVHCLDTADVDQSIAHIKSRYEKRLMEIFP